MGAQLLNADKGERLQKDAAQAKKGRKRLVELQRLFYVNPELVATQVPPRPSSTFTEVKNVGVWVHKLAGQDVETLGCNLVLVMNLNDWTVALDIFNIVKQVVHKDLGIKSKYFGQRSLWRAMTNLIHEDLLRFKTSDNKMPKLRSGGVGVNKSLPLRKCQPLTEGAIRGSMVVRGCERHGVWCAQRGARH